MEIRIDKNELKNLIKDAVKEVFEEKSLEFFLGSLPAVSNHLLPLSLSSRSTRCTKYEYTFQL
jgi:hypothetical protein